MISEPTEFYLLNRKSWFKNLYQLLYLPNIYYLKIIKWILYSTLCFFVFSVVGKFVIIDTIIIWIDYHCVYNTICMTGLAVMLLALEFLWFCLLFEMVCLFLLIHGLWWSPLATHYTIDVYIYLQCSLH